MVVAIVLKGREGGLGTIRCGGDGSKEQNRRAERAAEKKQWCRVVAHAVDQGLWPVRLTEKMALATLTCRFPRERRGDSIRKSSQREDLRRRHENSEVIWYRHR